MHWNDIKSLCLTLKTHAFLTLVGEHPSIRSETLPGFKVPPWPETNMILELGSPLKYCAHQNVTLGHFKSVPCWVENLTSTNSCVASVPSVMMDVERKVEATVHQCSNVSNIVDIQSLDINVVNWKLANLCKFTKVTQNTNTVLQAWQINCCKT